jgi:L-lysine 2,3-aminomutase
MVTNSLGNRHHAEPGTWQQQLAAAITDPAQLLARLQLDPALLDPAGLAGLQQGAQGFRLRVPESFVRRMRPGDPSDPLLRKVLTLGLESAHTPGFSSDPLAESEARLAPGLLQKYQGRALLITMALTSAASAVSGVVGRQVQLDHFSAARPEAQKVRPTSREEKPQDEHGPRTKEAAREL